MDAVLDNNLGQLQDSAYQLVWRDVPAAAIELAEKCAEMAPAIRKAIRGLPELGAGGYGQVFWNPYEKTAWVVSSDSDENDTCRKYMKALYSVPGIDEVRIEAEYFPEAQAEPSAPWVKVAYSVTGRRLLEALQIAPGTPFGGGIPNSPGPIQSMLAGGLLGSGLGYSAGWLGEKLLPNDWKRKRMRRTLAILGGLAGAAPGGLWMYHNMVNSKPLNDASLFNSPPPVNDAPFKGLRQRAPIPAEPVRPKMLPGSGGTSPASKIASDTDTEYGSDSTGYSFPPVRVNEFNHVIWSDPRVSDPIPYALQAAGSGLMTGAAYSSPRGRNSSVVTPADIARMSVGMGTGYASGALVGKGLSLLFGMPESTQEKLKNIGMFAGVLKTLIPLAFGG